MTTISVPGDSIANLFRLIASYGGLDASTFNFLSGKVSSPECVDSNGQTVSGLGTVARYVAQQTPAAAQLLGENPEDQAKVAEWVAFCLTELTPLMDDKLVKVNDWLLKRTVLVGNTISLADLMIYATVQPAVTAFPVAQHGHFCNLMRWYDYIHHVADTSNIFPAATFIKPKFVAPKPQPKPAKAAPEKAAPANGTTTSATSKAKDQKAPPAVTANGTAAAKAEKAAKRAASKGAAASSTTTNAPATPAASTEAAGAIPDNESIDLVDLRVGTIVKVDNHPNADALYVEDIDLGEETGPRQIVSGLRKFVPLEEMQGRRVVVVCNLKPAKMRDVMSYGMVLCASNDAHDVVVPVSPPEGVPNGERIKFEGYDKEPEGMLNPKKKQFEKIAPHLITNADCLCTYRGIPFMTSKGPVTAAIPNAAIK